jgi:hypothetical protein
MNKTTPRCPIIKLLKTSNKEKTLKAIRKAGIGQTLQQKNKEKNGSACLIQSTAN